MSDNPSLAFTPESQKIARGPEDEIPRDLPSVHDLVLQDITDRREFGIKKYGVPLHPFDGSDPLKEAYQEALDLVIYLRQALFEVHGR